LNDTGNDNFTFKTTSGKTQSKLNSLYQKFAQDSSEYLGSKSKNQYGNYSRDDKKGVFM
jgi:hypothetical protein